MSDNRRSKAITQGPERAPNRAMLRATGFGDDDFTAMFSGGDEALSKFREVIKRNGSHKVAATLAP